MSRSTLQRHRKLAFGFEQMVGRYPFYAPLLDGWELIEDSGVATMGVARGRDSRVQLHFNPAFVARITTDELVNVLLHEVHHVLFSHLTMTPGEDRDAMALVIAKEVTANEFISGSLPGEPLRLEQFPELPPFESTPVRYERLLRNPSKEDIPHCDCLLASETVDADAWGPLLSSDVRNALRRLPRSSRRRALERFKWLREALPGRTANVPAPQPTGGGQIDWSGVLHRLIPRPTERTVSRRRPSRRLPLLTGIVPGTVRRPTRPSVMAVLDTSASMMTDAILGTLRRELKALANVVDVMVVECDVHVRREYRYSGEITKVVGGGVTSFCEPLSEAFLARHRVDAVLYFTDGNGIAPARPPDVKIGWCLFGVGSQRPAPWGLAVHLPY